MELAITIDAGEIFVKSTYVLEGDGELAFRAFEEVQWHSQKLMGDRAIQNFDGALIRVDKTSSILISNKHEIVYQKKVVLKKTATKQTNKQT